MARKIMTWLFSVRQVHCFQFCYVHRVKIYNITREEKERMEEREKKKLNRANKRTYIFAKDTYNKGP